MCVNMRVITAIRCFTRHRVRMSTRSTIVDVSNTTLP